MCKKNICVDFDGVLNIYTKYDENNLGKMREGCEEFLQELFQKYNVIVFTCRNQKKVEQWLNDNNLYKYISAVTNIKVPAVMYIDDRALKFDGDYSKTLEFIKNYN